MDDEPTLRINRLGTKEWRLPNGKPHRVDGPAYEGASGGKQWYLHGKLHRVDGPAVERANGDKWWFLNGKSCSFDNWLTANNYISEEEKLMLKLTYG